MRICFASHNKNKVKEMNAIMPKGISLVGLSDVGIDEEIAETGSTFAENAHIKADFVYDKLKMPVFADDSGLMVEALNGDPGVFSARYAGADKDDQKNMDLLLDNLKGADDRSAQFKTVIAFRDHSGMRQTFEGSIAGVITHEKKGQNGFGYDPIFQPEDHDLTFAELPAEVKNRISHRARAVHKLLEYLSDLQ